MSARRDRLIRGIAAVYWADPAQYQEFPEAMILDIVDAIEAMEPADPTTESSNP